MRKPLIVCTPKSILRYPKAVSRADELTGGSFREVLGDTTVSAGDQIRRVIFCSGKVYYDLLAAREEKQISNIAIARVEQLYPFPGSQISDILARYAPSAEVVWVQEEPRNMGGWRFVAEQMRPILDPATRRLRYIGRPEAASPATGAAKRHAEEQADIVNRALSADALPAPSAGPARRKKLVKRRRAS